jgi:hypothetical protein
MCLASGHGEMEAAARPTPRSPSAIPHNLSDKPPLQCRGAVANLKAGGCRRQEDS